MSASLPPSCSDALLDKNHVPVEPVSLSSFMSPDTAPSLRKAPGNCFLPCIPATSGLSLSRTSRGTAQHDRRGVEVSHFLPVLVEYPRGTSEGGRTPGGPAVAPGCGLCVGCVCACGFMWTGFVCPGRTPAVPGRAVRTPRAGAATTFPATFLADCVLLSLPSFTALLTASKT